MVDNEKPAANGFVRMMRKVYHPLGFKKGYNFPLFVIFGGAVMGFVLSRLPYLSLDGVLCHYPNLSKALGSSPGECWNYDVFRGHERIGIILHLVGVLPAYFLAVFQFIPIIRQKLLLLHRIDGYIIITLLLLGEAGALMVCRRAFGGTLATQTAVGMSVIVTTISVGMAYYNIKRLQIEQHRAWMLRTFFYAGSIITQRILMFTMVTIESYYTNYYFSEPCYKIVYMYQQILGPKAGPHVVQGLYPSCATYFSGKNLEANAAVQAQYLHPKGPEQVAAIFDMTFGASIWMAFFLHVIGVEIYLRMTPAEHNRLRQVSYEKQLEAGFKKPGFGGTTVQQWGDALPSTPKGIEDQELKIRSGSNSLSHGL